MSVENSKKQKKKGPIKFDLELNEEQKKGKAVIINSDITIVRGNAGSGKTLLACQAGLDGFFRGDYQRLILARPAVTAGEDLGFLPGDKKEKLLEFIQPILDNLNQLYGSSKIKRDKIEKHMEAEEIQLMSVGHLRGRTFTNAFVIVDEAQNLTEKQMEMVVTRLGVGSKMVITGDLKQQDLKGASGLGKLLLLVEKISKLNKVDLEMNHRSGIVKDLLEQW
jgi:phosphate starvation-inducible PhoH-like protein